MSTPAETNGSQLLWALETDCCLAVARWRGNPGRVGGPCNQDKTAKINRAVVEILLPLESAHGFQQRSDELVSQEVGTYVSQSYGNHYDDGDGVFGVHDEAVPVLRAMPKATAMAQPNAPPAMS